MSSEVKKNPVFSFRYLVCDFVRLTAVLPGLIWFRPKVLYPTKEARRKIRGGAVLISNHIAFTDPIALMLAVWYRRHHFICLKSFFEGKSAWFFRHFLCIPIDRENFRPDSLHEIERELNAGSLVSMFPEGHIVEDAGLKTFKSGMVLMAYRTGVPIVPAYILPRTRSGRLKLAVGEPVDVRALCGEKLSLKRIEAASRQLYQKEAALKAFAETGVWEEPREEEA